MPAIQATRQLIRNVGKISRYRPSSEALCRRLLRGLSLLSDRYAGRFD